MNNIMVDAKAANCFIQLVGYKKDRCAQNHAPKGLVDKAVFIPAAFFRYMPDNEIRQGIADRRGSQGAAYGNKGRGFRFFINPVKKDLTGFAELPPQHQYEFFKVLKQIFVHLSQYSRIILHHRVDNDKTKTFSGTGIPGKVFLKKEEPVPKPGWF
jgi:hypothetical protein